MLNSNLLSRMDPVKREPIDAVIVPCIGSHAVRTAP